MRAGAGLGLTGSVVSTLCCSSALLSILCSSAPCCLGALLSRCSAILAPCCFVVLAQRDSLQRQELQEQLAKPGTLGMGGHAVVYLKREGQGRAAIFSTDTRFLPRLHGSKKGFDLKP